MSCGENLEESILLKLNCDKALLQLNWLPTLGFYETVNMTMDWYKTFYESKSVSMRDFTLAQIDEYTNLAVSRKINWSLI